MTDDYAVRWEEPKGGYSLGLPHGFWVFVTGGGLPGEVALRLDWHADGRWVFTGLLIATDPAQPQEITSQTLRQIRLSAIQAAVFGDADPLDPKSPLSQIRPHLAAARIVATLAAEARGFPVGGGTLRGPDKATLQNFAHTYQRELARQPRRAMTAAAQAHNISRATANRWAVTCRELGILPSASSGEEPSS